MNRLLTDEEIMESGAGMPPCTRSKHRTQERVALHIEASRRVCKAQDHKTARSIIEEIEGKAERVTCHNVPIGKCLQAEDWQALKEKWLGKR